MKAGFAKPKHGADEVFEILDTRPEVMDRPLRLIDGKSYLATWLPIGNSTSEQQEQRLELFILDEAGNAYSTIEVPGIQPASELPFIIDLPLRPKAEKLLSPTAFKAFLRGERPSPARLTVSRQRHLHSKPVSTTSGVRHWRLPIGLNTSTTLMGSSSGFRRFPLTTPSRVRMKAASI